MTVGKNFPSDFLAAPGSAFGGLAVDRKGRLKLSPENDLDANEALVSDQDTVEIGSTGINATLSVAASALSGASIPATSAVVSDQDTVEVNGVEGAVVGVAANAVTGVTLPGTSLVISNDDEIEVEGVTYKFTVAGGVITKIEEA